jgi:hypothetical protein
MPHGGYKMDGSLEVTQAAENRYEICSLEYQDTVWGRLKTLQVTVLIGR